MEGNVNALQGDRRLSAFEGNRQRQRPGLANEISGQRVEFACRVCSVNSFLQLLGTVGSLRDVIDELAEYVKIGSLLKVSMLFSLVVWKPYRSRTHVLLSFQIVVHNLK